MASMQEMELPRCWCHDQPMHRNGRGNWRCAVRDRARQRERYASDAAYRERVKARALARYHARSASGV